MSAQSTDGTEKVGPDGKSTGYYRGKFKMDESWSKDKTTTYFEGPKMKIGWPLAKTWVLFVLYYVLRS